VPETLGVSPQQPDAAVIDRAVAVLRAGGLLIYPTDTLYAIGGRALDAAAADAVREAKGRGDGKPLPVIAADAKQARSIVAAWPEAAQRLAAAFWPGPLMLVLPAAPSVPREVTAGTDTVAVRVPALAVSCRLAAGAGPLVSTSANRSGLPPPLTCAEAVQQVGAAAALALDAGPGRPVPSTIVDLTGSEPSLVRSGAVEWEQVRRVLWSISRSSTP
jgi:L-threonylcarbamoyladenylate synthase